MSKLILVIEDQEDNRRIVRDLLTSASYDVTEAVTGEDGVTAAETHRPDLILLKTANKIQSLFWPKIPELKAGSHNIRNTDGSRWGGAADRAGQY